MTDHPALYRDGLSAADQPVQVRALGHGLEIRTPTGVLVQCWPLARIRRDRDAAGTGLRLRCPDFPTARLILDDPGPWADLLPASKANGALWAGLAAGALAIMCLLVWGLPHFAALTARLIPVDTERAWGAVMSRDMTENGRTCSGRFGLAALEDLVTRLGGSLPPDHRPERVLVVKNPMVNALALPGGTILLFDGLLRQAQSADEVAGVLAHEMGHVAERHPLQAAIRSVGLAAMLTLFTGDMSALAASAGGMALAGAYSREDEARADALAVQYLDRAGIAATGLAGFFTKLKGKGGDVPALLSSHPDLDSRERMVRTLTRPGTTSPALTNAQWLALRHICD